MEFGWNTECLLWAGNVAADAAAVDKAAKSRTWGAGMSLDLQLGSTNTGARSGSAEVCVVIPTYNEAPNLERIVHAVMRELDGLVPGRYGILVVDDGSPDGTGEIADRLAEQFTAVEVLHRAAKAGLGHAYVAAFDRALVSGVELVIQMDADFSHDPKYLGDLLAAAEQADLVIGSRYVDGGGVRDWGLLRRFISRGGCVYARLLLGVDVHDVTGGFKCIHRRVLDAIDLDGISAEGYVFQTEVTYRALLAGFRVREVPIVFSDRTAGTSKMSARIAVEAMWLIPRLRRSQRRRSRIRSRAQPQATATLMPEGASSDQRLAERMARR